MELHHTLQTYRRYARAYDVVFGRIMDPGRKTAVQLANTGPDQRILEVGVGTGLSLPLFRPDSHVTGIDVSPEMLAKARDKVTAQGLAHVEDIQEMDAESMSFADDSFDAVLALYVASVVPDPVRFVQEMSRVCVEGGRIVILNHFSTEGPIMKRVESWLAPLAHKIGFHSDFPLDRFLESTRLEVRQRRPANVLGYWTILDCVNRKQPA